MFARRIQVSTITRSLLSMLFVAGCNTGVIDADNPYASIEGERATMGNNDADPPVGQWVPLQLLGSWHNANAYGLAQAMARLDSSGSVRLRGTVAGGACGSLGYLPPKLRPTQGVRAYMVSSNGKPLGVHVDPFSGEIRTPTSCDPNRVSLDGIEFVTNQTTSKWHALGGWVWQNANAYGLARAGYYEGPDEVIRLTGTIKTLTCPRVSFTLPQDVWPTGGVGGHAVSTSAGGTWTHVVPWTGAVRFEAECGTWVSLDGVRFPAEGQWTSLATTNGWHHLTGYGLAQPSYTKDNSGRVFLRGSVIGDACKKSIATLPAGYRPGGGVRVYRAVGGGATSEVIVNPFNGEIHPNCTTPSISLDSISFRID